MPALRVPTVVGLVLGLAVAAGLVRGWRVPVATARAGAALTVAATGSGALILTAPAGPLLEARGLRPGRPAVGSAHTLAVTSIAGEPAELQIRTGPGRVEAEDELRLRVRVRGATRWSGTLEQLRRWRPLGLRLAPRERLRLRVEADVAPGAGEGPPGGGRGGAARPGGGGGGGAAAAPGDGRRSVRALRRGVGGAALGLTLGLLVAVAGPRLIGWETFTVLSGSMQPTLRTGDIVVDRPVRPEQAHVGDVVTFRDPLRDRVLTHRVRRVERTGAQVAFVTRGDANTGEERWTAPTGGRLGRVAYRVPKGGYVSRWVGSRPGRLGLVVLPVVLLAVSLLRQIWGVGPRRDGGAPAAPAS